MSKSIVNRVKLESAWFQLLAGIYSNYEKTPAEIQQKELKREWQRVKRFRLIGTAVGLVILGALFFAWLQWGKEQQQFYQKLSEQLASRAQEEQSKQIGL